MTATAESNDLGRTGETSDLRTYRETAQGVGALAHVTTNEQPQPSTGPVSPGPGPPQDLGDTPTPLASLQRVHDDVGCRISSGNTSEGLERS